MAAQPSQTQAPINSTPPHNHTIADHNLEHALIVLSDMPAEELSAISTLHIEMTESNVLYWYGCLWSQANDIFEEKDLAEFAQLYPAAAAFGSESSPRQDFCELVRFVAENFDLAKLDLEINVANAAWRLHEKVARGAEPTEHSDQEWEFLYDLYMDVGKILADEFRDKKPREVQVETSIWEDLGPEIANQVLGKPRMANAQKLPVYHDVKMQLWFGSAV